MHSQSDLLAAVGAELLRRRMERGLSLEDAATNAGLDGQRLVAAENGETRLTSDEFESIADAYGIDVVNFFGGRTTPLAYFA
jgi:transcriptional regulator with XRE-family HTH domain